MQIFLYFRYRFFAFLQKIYTISSPFKYTFMKKYCIAILTIIMIAINALGAMGKLGLSMANLNTIFTFHYMPPASAFEVSWGLVYILQIFYVFLIFRDKHDISEREFTLNTILILANIIWMIFTTQ